MHKTEPVLTASMKRVSKEKEVSLKTAAGSDLSFFYDRKKNEVHIFNDGKKMRFTKDDYVFVRRWGPNAASTTLLCILLETLGVKYLDSGINTHREVRSSKIAQMLLAPHFNVHFPSAWVFTKTNVLESIDKVEKKFSYPVVLKTQGAGRGRHVWKCTSRTDLVRKIKSAQKKFGKDLYVIQEYIPNESDIRVMMYKGKILTVIERSSNNGFYNNISQGGSGKVIKLTPEEKRIAKAASKAAKLDLAGVDIVRTQYGPLLFEVNKAPDIKCFNEIAGFDIGEALAREILK